MAEFWTVTSLKDFPHFGPLCWEVEVEGGGGWVLAFVKSQAGSNLSSSRRLAPKAKVRSIKCNTRIFIFKK